MTYKPNIDPSNIQNNILNYYEKRKKESIKHTDDYFYHCANACESPIEQLMIAEIFAIGMRDGINNGKPFDRFCPQYKVGVYRIDIALFLELGSNSYKLAIECDGHDYHERTEKQARRDKKKDRYLQSQGWLIARFTGSEIYKNPCKCLEKAIDMVIELDIANG